MRTILLSPLLIPFVASAVVLLSWHCSDRIERASFSFFMHGSLPEPHFITHDDSGWSVRTLSMEGRKTSDAPLACVRLGDDPDAIFQSSPHAPIDLALIARNLRETGGDAIALGVVMAWESPDVLGLAALERALDQFATVLITAPLARGATVEMMPAAFRRASLPMDVLRGDASQLPIVNRQAVPDVFMAGENVLAGFSLLAHEADDGAPYLLAVWEDRVVLSFPLLVAIVQAGVDLASMEIHPGHYIRLGSGDWMIPIDQAGRLDASIENPTHVFELDAEELLDAEIRSALDAPSIWLIRDLRSMIDRSLRKESTRIIPVVDALMQRAILTKPLAFRTPASWQQGALLISIVVLLSTLIRYPAIPLHAGLACTWVGLVLLQWIAMRSAAIWMPATHGILACLMVCIISIPIIMVRQKIRLRR